jgi:hypothetical protein
MMRASEPMDTSSQSDHQFFVEKNNDKKQMGTGYLTFSKHYLTESFLLWALTVV